MRELWRSRSPLTPAAMLDLLGNDLAYTTVMTILTRLWKKGLVTRARDGRAFAYTAALTEAEFLAGRMEGELKRTDDRTAVLSRFVDQLSSRDLTELRKLVGED